MRARWTSKVIVGLFGLAAGALPLGTLPAVASDGDPPSDVVVTTPANVEATAAPGSVAVTWDPSTGDAGVQDYLVTLRGAPDGKTYGRWTTDTSATFTLPPGGKIQVSVTARDQAGRWSDSSPPVAVTIPPAADWTPPQAPSNLRAVTDGAEIVFQWEASPGGVAPIEYRIKLDGVTVDFSRETRLRSPYFAECTSPTQISASFTVAATSWGLESPPSNAIELCFA
jgi:hypothetical protein